MAGSATATPEPEREGAAVPSNLPKQRTHFIGRERRALVVLDNCEHVLSAAAELADALVGASAELKLLVTSREGLGIEGERLFALRSLSVPAAGVERQAVEASEAARLFVDRAQG